MLVLTRKVGERVNIGENIVLSVLDISKGNVRLGIEAPENISILRHEVYQRILEENIRSAEGTYDDLAKVINLWNQNSNK